MVSSLKGLQEWIILLKIPDPVANRQLAMAHWEKALERYHSPWREFLGSCYALVCFSSPHLDEQINFQSIAERCYASEHKPGALEEGPDAEGQDGQDQPPRKEDKENQGSPRELQESHGLG